MPQPSPTLIRSRCESCNRPIYTRKNALYCSDKCRAAIRQETAKLLVPNMPKSNIKGITYNRQLQSWEIRIKIDNQWKYIGCKKELEHAISFQKHVLTF